MILCSWCSTANLRQTLKRCPLRPKAQCHQPGFATVNRGEFGSLTGATDTQAATYLLLPDQALVQAPIPKVSLRGYNS